MSLETETAPERRRRVRIWHVLVGIVVVLIVVVLLLRCHWKREFRRRIDTMLAAGIPMAPEELEAWYPAPESGENGAQAVVDAAQGYVDALSRAEARSLDQLHRLTRCDPLEDETVAALKRLVADNQEMLARLQEAAGFAHHHYDLDWSAGSLWSTRPMPDLNQALTFLQRSAALAFEEQRAGDALDSLVALLVIGRSVGEIPTLAGYFGSMRARTDAINILEHGMHRMMLTQKQLQRVQAALWVDDTPEMLGHAMASQMCLMLPMFEDPVSLKDYERLPPVPVLEAYVALGLAAREGDIILDVVASYVEVTRRPLHQWLAEIQRVEDKAKEDVVGCLLVGAEGGFNLSHIPMAHLIRTARLRAALAGLAVERYRLAHATLPGSLDDLVPEYIGSVPQDPYTGQTLRYEKMGAGFIVYSVGKDGIDDGGWEEPPPDQRTAGQTYDVTFTVER